MLDNNKRQELVIKLIIFYGRLVSSLNKELSELGIKDDVVIAKLRTKISFLDGIKGFLAKERIHLQPNDSKKFNAIVKTYFQVKEYSNKALLTKGGWEDYPQIQKILSEEDISENDFLQYLYEFTEKVCEDGDPVNVNIVIEIEKINDEGMPVYLEKIDKFYLSKKDDGTWIYTERIEHEAGSLIK